MELVPNHNRVSRLLSSEKFKESNPFDRPFLHASKTVLARKRDRARGLVGFPTGSPRSPDPGTQASPAFLSPGIPPSACEPS